VLYTKASNMNLQAAANVAAMTLAEQLADVLPTAVSSINLLNPGPPPTSAAASAVSLQEQKQAAQKKDKEDEQQNAEGDDAAEDVSYKPYRPLKIKFGKPHPDPVVENSTLSAVEPPDIFYNLAIPAEVIHKGKLSDLQLEAIVYGSQRHHMNLPKPPTPKEDNSEDENIIPQPSTTVILQPSTNVIPQPSTKQKAPPSTGSNKRKSPHSSASSSSSSCNNQTPPVPVRCGFLLGDGAGMGKGRTLAAFCYENIMRGRTKHLWISVSGDLYQDAKRDLRDLGLDDYANKHCHLLGKMPYSKIKEQEGLIFSTYRTLIGVSKGGTRLGQLLDWCGEDFDGLILFDECHKAKNIKLDAEGNIQNLGSAECSRTAAAVVELQQKLPRARVVYCSATAVSEPFNLGFMSRLGLWGPGTEHPSGFNQFLESIKRLGCGTYTYVHYTVHYCCSFDGNAPHLTTFSYFLFPTIPRFHGIACYVSQVQGRHGGTNTELSRVRIQCHFQRHVGRNRKGIRQECRLVGGNARCSGQ
jgi:hypothetical protein